MLTANLVRERALELGFDLVGFAPAGPVPEADRFLAWLSAGHHGQMAYMAREPERRLDPRRVMPGARTVIIVGLSYETLAVPAEVLQDPSRGRIARYAWGADYHDVMTPVLRAFGEWLAKESRAYVDTGPVLERAWAERCGLGFIGKNTCLIHRKRGSYLFLGAVFVNEELRMENEEIGTARSNSQFSILNFVNAAPAPAAWLPARPTPSLRQACSMRDAASRISPSN